jgi:DNA ligase (NAD+)
MSQATDALPEARAPLSYSALAEVVLAGKTVAITGRLEQFSQSEAQGLIEGLGARVVDKMSGQVDVLVAGYDVGTKFADATDRGILILGELDLLHLAKPDRPEYI